MKIDESMNMDELLQLEQRSLKTREKTVSEKTAISVCGSALDEMNSVASDFDFESRLIGQRGNIPKAHNIRNNANNLTREGVAALKRGDYAAVHSCSIDNAEAWVELKELDLPGDLGWQFDSEAGQEIQEFHMVLWAYPLIFGGKVIEPNFPSPSNFLPEDLRDSERYHLTSQAYLAGTADAVGELSKLVRSYTIEKNLDLEEQSAIKKKFLETAKMILAFLEQWADIPPMIINNSRRRGFGNTYRGMIGRVEGNIERMEESLLQMHQQASVLESYGLEKKEAGNGDNS